MSRTCSRQRMERAGNDRDALVGGGAARGVPTHGDPDGVPPLMPPSPTVAWPTQRRLLPDVLRRVAESRTRPYHSPRDMVLWRELAAMAAGTRPDDPASLARIRLPLLRRILEAEWGKPALRDEITLAMLRAVDGLVAVDPEMSDVLRRAVVALKRLY